MLHNAMRWTGYSGSVMPDVTNRLRENVIRRTNSNIVMKVVQQADCYTYCRCRNDHQRNVKHVCKLMYTCKVSVGSLPASCQYIACAGCVPQMWLSCSQCLTLRAGHPLRSPCHAMTSAASPTELHIPPPPPPLPSSKSTTLASLLAEEQFNLYYLLAILFPVITTILGEFGRHHIANLQHVV
jgi:hypothetical protein